MSFFVLSASGSSEREISGNSHNCSYSGLGVGYYRCSLFIVSLGNSQHELVYMGYKVEVEWLRGKE